MTKENTIQQETLASLMAKKENDYASYNGEYLYKYLTDDFKNEFYNSMYKIKECDSSLNNITQNGSNRNLLKWANNKDKLAYLLNLMSDQNHGLYKDKTNDLRWCCDFETLTTSAHIKSIDIVSFHSIGGICFLPISLLVSDDYNMYKQTIANSHYKYRSLILLFQRTISMRSVFEPKQVSKIISKCIINNDYCDLESYLLVIERGQENKIFKKKLIINKDNGSAIKQMYNYFLDVVCDNIKNKYYELSKNLDYMRDDNGFLSKCLCNYNTIEEAISNFRTWYNDILLKNIYNDDPTDNKFIDDIEPQKQMVKMVISINPFDYMKMKNDLSTNVAGKMLVDISTAVVWGVDITIDKNADIDNAFRLFLGKININDFVYGVQLFSGTNDYNMYKQTIANIIGNFGNVSTVQPLQIKGDTDLPMNNAINDNIILSEVNITLYDMTLYTFDYNELYCVPFNQPITLKIGARTYDWEYGMRLI